MDYDDIENPTTFLPQEILANNDQQHLNEDVVFSEIQNVDDINLIYTEPQIFMNAFNMLNPTDQDEFTNVLVDEPVDFFDDINIDELNNFSTSHDVEPPTSSSQPTTQSSTNDFSSTTSSSVATPASSNQSRIQLLPNQVNCYTSLPVAPPASSNESMIRVESSTNDFSYYQYSPPSSSHSMIQSSPNNISSSTSSTVASPASSSHTMIQLLPNDVNCYTSLPVAPPVESSTNYFSSSQYTPPSSSHSMIQSSPNNLSSSTSSTVASPASSSHSMIQLLPNDVNCYTSLPVAPPLESSMNYFSSFQYSPPSSSHSMIQPSPNDFSSSTSSTVASPASSSQSVMPSPASYDLEPTLQQQHDYDDSVFTLDIPIEPHNTCRFRYISEKDSHGFLRGAGSVANNTKHTTVRLQLPKLNHANAVDVKFYVRFTLHQADSATSSKLIHPALSPHQLLRRIKIGKSKELFDETELYDLDKDRNFSFELTNFFIARAPINQCQTFCSTKRKKLNEQKFRGNLVHSNLVLNVAGEDFTEASPGTKKRTEQAVNPIQVKIGFEAFRFINNTYTSIAGPIFSEPITHGEPLNIVRLCNVYVSSSSKDEDEDEMVTLLVSKLETLDIRIHLQEKKQECDKEKQKCDIKNNIKKLFGECIVVAKDMVHQKAAITFKMPRYQGGQERSSNIECTIQLERLCDKARSDVYSIYYKALPNELKPSGDDTIRKIHGKRAMLADNGEVTQKALRLQPDAVLFTGTTTLSTDTKTNRSLQRIARTRANLHHSAECHAEQINIESKNIGKANQELIAFLRYIKNWYNESKNTQIGMRKDYAQKIKDYFLAYEREHPAGNSLLHDILSDENLKEYEIEMYKITEHFEVGDIVSQSTNIYGETALMFACKFNRPLLMSALVSMGTPIEAQAIANGNNVLHIAMKQQSNKCYVSLMDDLKKDKNPSSFIKALGSYNYQGLTPLHLAVLQNNVPFVSELLQFCKRQKAFDVCQLGQQTDGNTILHLAVLNRFEDMCACIREHSGDSFKNIINYADQTAEEIMLDMDEDDMEENDELDTLVDTLGGIQLKDAASE